MAHTVVLKLDSDSRGSKYSSNSTLDLFGFEGGGIHSPNSNIRFIRWRGGTQTVCFNIRFIG